MSICYKNHYRKKNFFVIKSMRRSARVFESDRLLATAVSGEICRYGGSEIDAKKTEFSCDSCNRHSRSRITSRVTHFLRRICRIIMISMQNSRRMKRQDHTSGHKVLKHIANRRISLNFLMHRSFSFAKKEEFIIDIRDLLLAIS